MACPDLSMQFTSLMPEGLANYSGLRFQKLAVD